jgi:hypothetical protein
MPVNPQAFQRLRILQDGAIPVTEGDLAGPLLKALGAIHRKQEKRVFATQGIDGNSPWAALSPAYAVRKKRQFPGRKILVRMGEMKKVFTQTGPGYIQRYKKPLIQFGAISRVAGFHRSGSSVMPAREPVPKSVTHLEELRAGIMLWYRKRTAQVLRGAARLREGG